MTPARVAIAVAVVAMSLTLAWLCVRLIRLELDPLSWVTVFVVSSYTLLFAPLHAARALEKLIPENRR